MKDAGERNVESPDGRSASPDWRVMWKWMQQIHCFSRNMTKQQQNRELTMGEMEVLAVVSLESETTPMRLSRATGMKLEAVSRTLRSLESKGCIRRKKLLSDARILLITVISIENEYMIRIRLQMIPEIFCLLLVPRQNNRRSPFLHTESGIIKNHIISDSAGTD